MNINKKRDLPGRKKAFRLPGNRRGESLIETLVSILIGALAMTMLATMIVTSTRMTHESTEKFDEYYAANNLVAAKDPAGKVTGTGTIILYEGDDADREDPDHRRFLLTDGAEITVEYYVNDKSGRIPVVAYEMPEE